MSHSFHFGICLLFLLMGALVKGDVPSGAIRHDYLPGLSVYTFGKVSDLQQNVEVPSFALSSLSRENLYAIGMPQGIDRELLFLNGDLYSTQIKNFGLVSKLENEPLRSEFLLFAYVPAWKKYSVPHEVKTHEELESHIIQVASQAHFDVSKPFPFMLRANVTGLKWFVVGGRGNLLPNLKESIFRTWWRGGLDDRTIGAVGFYMPQGQGIYTPPNSQMHIHFKTLDAPLFVGHLDGYVLLKEGAELFLPEINK